MSDLKPETLEVPDRVRRQIEDMVSRLEAAESALAGDAEGAAKAWDAETDRADRAESALTEALDALDEGGGPAEAARIRSQIEGPVRGKFTGIVKWQIEGSNDG